MTRAARSTCKLISEDHKDHKQDTRTFVGTWVPWLCSGAATIDVGGDMGAVLTPVVNDMEEARRMRSVLVEATESLAYSQV